MQNPFEFDPADAAGPVLRPKDAAALVLVRRRGDEARVLMGERSARHAFLPGRFVFPGGRLDVADQRLAVETICGPTCVPRWPPARPRRARGASRLRRARDVRGNRHPRGEERSGRCAHALGYLAAILFPRRVAEVGGARFVARAITPPGRPRRFDARFFMADASEIAVELDQSNASGELLKPVWLTLAEARAADVLPITRCVLDEVEGRLNGERDRPPRSVLHPRRGKAVILSL
jgi:8-oxo-dGTP pyrophosphatase MutT (NUDIX family)